MASSDSYIQILAYLIEYYHTYIVEDVYIRGL